MALQDTVEQAARGLGLELIEIERTSYGTLRITIDWPWDEGGSERWVTAEDCERLTHQLQYALEVENVDYKRLEVSSPGIDRKLRHEQDMRRFVGQLVDIELKVPIGADVAQGMVSANRKKFRGTLEAADAGWQIVMQAEVKAKPGAKISAKRLAQAPTQALGFVWDELAQVRLASVVNFKGRSAD
jgi:ribosome maturation factor RimP